MCLSVLGPSELGRAKDDVAVCLKVVGIEVGGEGSQFLCFGS